MVSGLVGVGKKLTFVALETDQESLRPLQAKSCFTPKAHCMNQKIVDYLALMSIPLQLNLGFFSPALLWLMTDM